jgi:CBS domain-containing protein
VREIMSAAPVCMAPDESVSDAARAMKQHGVGTVLLLTDGRLSGLVTERDITVRVLAENRDPRTTRIGDICSNELVVLDPDDDLARAARLARDHAVRRIPVLRDGTPVGLVSVGDLALEKDAASVLSGVSSAPPNS